MQSWLSYNFSLKIIVCEFINEDTLEQERSALVMSKELVKENVITYKPK